MEIAHLDKLTAIALVTMAALLCGLLLIRMRQPAIVGYILAGIVLGPTGFEIISNTETVQILAELGVIMLLFIIGMELSLRDFKSVYKIALATAGLQIIMAVGLFWIVGAFLGWSIERVLVFGFATAISSTAVAIKILEETGDLNAPVGRITVSVLIAQDLAVIPILLIISAFGANTAPGLAILIKIVLSIGFLGALTWFLSQRAKLALPLSNWIVSKPEIIPLAAMAFCFAWAALSGMLGLSTAYGAFVAGLIIGNSDVRASLFESPVRFDNHDDASLYLRTIILQRHVAALPEAHQEPFLREVIAETVRRFGEPFTADYVRLDIWATRAS